MKYLTAIGALAILLTTAQAGAAPNLLTNGDFEASSSTTATPPGWTQIGHSDGVITYAAFGTPAYDGLNYYDFGGFGDSAGPAGDGLQQTVATTIGASYTLVFGLSSENASTVPGGLQVSIGGTLFTFFVPQTAANAFQDPFRTITLNYTATGLNTTIAFTELLTAGNGNNDPLIDRVIFSAAGPSVVPEPAPIALLGLGIVGLALARRSRKRSR